MNQHREDRPLVSEPRYGSPDSPYLRANEAACYLRFASTRALYKAIIPQRIPHRRRGATLLFLVTELDRWLLDNTTGGERRHTPTLVTNARSR